MPFSSFWGFDGISIGSTHQGSRRIGKICRVPLLMLISTGTLDWLPDGAVVAFHLNHDSAVLIVRTLMRRTYGLYPSANADVVCTFNKKVDGHWGFCILWLI